MILNILIIQIINVYKSSMNKILSIKNLIYKLVIMNTDTIVVLNILNIIKILILTQ
uniref:Uncharacterized protein n=1 Tax=viral metagenome TaxID=1070528 RepID=A0A6C0H8F1_9ZZZZ